MAGRAATAAGMLTATVTRDLCRRVVVAVLGHRRAGRMRRVERKTRRVQRRDTKRGDDQQHPRQHAENAESS